MLKGHIFWGGIKKNDIYKSLLPEMEQMIQESRGFYASKKNLCCKFKTLKKQVYLGCLKNTGVSYLRYWVDKSTQLNKGSHIQNNDAPPHLIPRQFGNAAIKLMRLIIQ